MCERRGESFQAWKSDLCDDSQREIEGRMAWDETTGRTRVYDVFQVNCILVCGTLVPVH